MAGPSGINWPPLKGAYVDEFGSIDPDIYQAAGEIWISWAEKFAFRTIHDEHAGLRLLLKSAADVSRARATQGEQIINLKAYLSIAYKRLVLERMERDNRHRERDRQVLDLSSSTNDEADLNQKLLLQQLIQRMDAWTRQVFELLALGHSNEEIGAFFGMQANVVRSKYHKSLMKLKKQLEDETR
jgi:DNA-directed RNA polymerase specialized sigma24 family protein